MAIQKAHKMNIIGAIKTMTSFIKKEKHVEHSLEKKSAIALCVNKNTSLPHISNTRVTFKKQMNYNTDTLILFSLRLKFITLLFH